MRAALLLIVVLLAGCWPPTKFSAGAGGSVGGAVVNDQGRERMTEDVAATQLRMLVVIRALGPDPLDRRFDLAAGWEGEWLHPRDGSALLRNGFVLEGAWFAVTAEPARGVRWRIGPTVEVLAYGGGFGALVGVVAEYAFDKRDVGSSPDAGRSALGGIAGEMSVGVFLRGGVREHEAGERDGVILGGIELEMPGFCPVCGVSGGN